MTAFTVRIPSDETEEHVVIEDDGEVAYAYYVRHDAIASYVWLYNRAPSPEGIVQREDGKPPLNPKQFVAPMPWSPLPTKDDFEALFRHAGDDHETAILRGTLYAMMRADESPGWCLGAAEDGPVAQVLELPTS